MSAYDSHEFKKLKKKYYDEIKERGFRDIENEDGELIDFQSPTSFSKRIGFKTGLVEGITDYYTWAYERAVWGRFNTSEDQAIWLLHSEGKSSRTIGKVLGFDQTWIARKIKKIRGYLR